MTTLLIDGDVLLFRAALAAEQPINWADDLWTLHAEVSDGMEVFESQLESICKRTGVSSYRLCFSDRKCFRHDVNPEYKANRKKVRKPFAFPMLRKELSDWAEFIQWPNLEADDVMGILATSGEIAEPVIVTIDKDLAGIPGVHFNPDKDEFTRSIDAEYAHGWFLTQAIAGDPTDGYKGIPGIGIKRAKERLEKFGCTWNTVLEFYDEKGYSGEYALENARMAKILDASLWDAENREVILWKP